MTKRDRDGAFPSAREDEQAARRLKDTPQTRAPSYRLAFADADFLYPKSWGPIMVTEEEAEVEAMAAENTDWKATAARMGSAKNHAVYMHCMPVDRGYEADDDVIDGSQSVIYQQAENRLHIQKALMALTMAPRA